jgi:hypothetical protein
MIDSMTAMPIRGQTRQPTAPKAAGPPFGGVVAAGQSVVDPLVVDALATRRARPARSPRAALTPRELDVLREMAQGRTNAGIEQALHPSSSSVEKHVASISPSSGSPRNPCTVEWLPSWPSCAPNRIPGLDRRAQVRG